MAFDPNFAKQDDHTVSEEVSTKNKIRNLVEDDTPGKTKTTSLSDKVNKLLKRKGTLKDKKDLGVTSGRESLQ